MRFSDQVAIVTGAGSGIGAETARRLAEEGATVIVVDIEAHNAADVSATIRSDGGDARPYECDVSSREAVDTLVDAVAHNEGRIDIVINNAGTTRDNLLFKMTDDDWTRVIDVNLSGVFFMCRAAQRYMVPARRGRIVNISSVAALGNRGQANYAAAKAGVLGLTATLAIELGQFNITVNAVAPGYVATPMTVAAAERAGLTPEEAQFEISRSIALGRVAVPADVASAITFLASDDAAYVTGHTLFITGGLLWSRNR